MRVCVGLTGGWINRSGRQELNVRNRIVLLDISQHMLFKALFFIAVSTQNAEKFARNNKSNYLYVVD